MRLPRWAVLLGGLAACVTLPHPTAQDAARGASKWPEVSVVSLEQGRALYADRCSACHGLYQPSSRPPENWGRQVAKMAPRAHLTPSEQALVEQFVFTLSIRPPEPRR